MKFIIILLFIAINANASLDTCIERVKLKKKQIKNEIVPLFDEGDLIVKSNFMKKVDSEFNKLKNENECLRFEVRFIDFYLTKKDLFTLQKQKRDLCKLYLKAFNDLSESDISGNSLDINQKLLIISRALKCK